MRHKRNQIFSVLVAAALAIQLTGCAQSPGTAPSDDPINSMGANVATGDTTKPLILLDSPAGPGSSAPSLYATDDGRVLMSWLEPLRNDGLETATTRRGRFALRFATLQSEAWSEPQTIAESEKFFVNWADFPVLIESNGMLVAHWLQMNGGPGTSYDIHITHSKDGGATWSDSVIPHSDGTKTEHGFVSMVPELDGGFTAIWLDGRDFSEHEENVSPEMSLRASRFSGEGTQGREALLDPRICDCCQTSAEYIGTTLVVAYRDRSEEEVRDIWSVRRTPDGWQAPIRVAHDNWQIPGCPVNGPAVAGGPSTGAIAWFSLREGNPEVKVRFTSDGGKTYSQTILLDQVNELDIDAGYERMVQEDHEKWIPGIPLGRVDVEWVDDERVAVIWLVARGSIAEIVMQTVALDETRGRRYVLATTDAARASGFPRLVRSGARLIMAWTEPGSPSALHTGVVSLPVK